MHSRSYLLLNRELIKLKQEPLWGIEVTPLDEASLLDWDVTMLGPQDTPWEGGIFKLLVRFSPQYNDRPPEINFFTIPFHPNVDMLNGRPCLDFLDDISCWNPEYSMSCVLLTIQDMLAHPSLENAMNLEAANALEMTPAMYRQMVYDCVIASKRIAVGLPPHEEDESELAKRSKTPSDAKNKSRGKVVHKISFDDYLSVWNGIATTKVSRNAPNPLLKMLNKDPHFKNVHIDSSERVIRDARRQLENHHKLIYGVNLVKKECEIDPKSVLFQRLQSINQFNTDDAALRPVTAGDAELLLAWSQGIDPEEDVEALMDLQNPDSVPLQSSAVTE